MVPEVGVLYWLVLWEEGTLHTGSPLPSREGQVTGAVPAPAGRLCEACSVGCESPAADSGVGDVTNGQHSVDMSGHPANGWQATVSCPLQEDGCGLEAPRRSCFFSYRRLDQTDSVCLPCLCMTPG